MAYQLAQKAEEDLIGIYLTGYREFGEAQADKYHAGLEAAFELLSDNPRAGRERTEITPTVSVHPHGSHIIVYLIGENDDVLILRVRHSREDWIAHPL